MDPAASRFVPVDGPLDMRRTLGRLTHYEGATHESVDGVVWRGIQTPDGPAGLRDEQTDGGVRVDAFGPAARAAVALADDRVGVRDDPTAFETDDPVVAPLAKRHRGLRFGRCRQVVGHLVPTIIGQTVTGAVRNRAPTGGPMAARRGVTYFLGILRPGGCRCDSRSSGMDVTKSGAWFTETRVMRASA